MEYKLNGSEEDIVNPKIGLKRSALNGVKKDKEDSRDFIFTSSSEILSLPSKIDLRKYAREIENQLSTGSCVANALCSSLELMAKIDGKDVDLSRLFVYYWAREPYPELKEKDNGSYIRDAFKVSNHQGVPPESSWEFDESKVNEIPSDESNVLAQDKKVFAYNRINNGDINGVKSALAEGRPVTFGMYVFEDFFYLSGKLETHNYLGRNSGSAYAGGHAMTIIGYDDNLNGGSFIVENSWSSLWGDGGFWAMSYDIFNMDVMDLWVATDFRVGLTEPEPEPEPKELILEGFFDGIEKTFKTTLKKIIEMYNEFPSMREVLDSILESMRLFWERFKEVFK